MFSRREMNSMPRLSSSSTTPSLRTVNADIGVSGHDLKAALCSELPKFV
jgi:hypothetical protein